MAIDDLSDNGYLEENVKNSGNHMDDSTKEMLFYIVNHKEYAIDIEDVDEILHIEEVVGVPNSHACVMGLALVRNEVISIIDMSMVLDHRKMEEIEDIKNKIMLKAHFEGIHLAFCVDEIIGISRVDLKNIEKNSELSNQLVESNIKMDNKIFMLLNYDKIVLDIKSH